MDNIICGKRSNRHHLQVIFYRYLDAYFDVMGGKLPDLIVTLTLKKMKLNIYFPNLRFGPIENRSYIPSLCEAHVGLSKFVAFVPDDAAISSECSLKCHLPVFMVHYFCHSYVFERYLQLVTHLLDPAVHLFIDPVEHSTYLIILAIEIPLPLLMRRL